MTPNLQAQALSHQLTMTEKKKMKKEEVIQPEKERSEEEEWVEGNFHLTHQ